MVSAFAKVANASSRRPAPAAFGKPMRARTWKGLRPTVPAIDRFGALELAELFQRRPRLRVPRAGRASDRPPAEKIGGRCNAARSRITVPRLLEFGIPSLQTHRTARISSSPSNAAPVWCSSKPRKCAAAAWIGLARQHLPIDASASCGAGLMQLQRLLHHTGRGPRGWSARTCACALL